MGGGERRGLEKPGGNRPLDHVRRQGGSARAGHPPKKYERGFNRRDRMKKVSVLVKEPGCPGTSEGSFPRKINQ